MSPEGLSAGIDQSRVVVLPGRHGLHPRATRRIPFPYKITCVNMHIITLATTDPRQLTQSVLQAAQLLGMYQAELARILSVNCWENGELANAKKLRTPIRGDKRRCLFASTTRYTISWPVMKSPYITGYGLKIKH
jgi:hypothetical protein